MDEYLYLTLARLNADRHALERQQRRLEADPEQLRLELPESGARRFVVPARRHSAPGPLVFATATKEETVMRSALMLAGALAVHLVALGALHWDVTQSSVPPPGEVTITQLEAVAPLAPLALAEDESGQTHSRQL